MGAGLAADGNGNQEVDADDYTVWKNQYVATAGGGLLAAPNATVPEPSLMGVCCMALGAWFARSRRRALPASSTD
jgi:hypothetical protein